MKLFGDLESPILMYLKAFLFLVAGSCSVLALWLEMPNLKVAFLLGVAIVSFCRLYYFMFYVIEKYVDPGFRFAGLSSFLLYLLRRRVDRSPPSMSSVGQQPADQLSQQQHALACQPVE